jgi:hypothetical protein
MTKTGSVVSITVPQTNHCLCLFHQENAADKVEFSNIPNPSSKFSQNGRQLGRILGEFGIYQMFNLFDPGPSPGHFLNL